MKNNNNDIVIILILVIVLGFMVGITREAAKTDKVEMASSEATLTEIENLNDEVDDLFTTVVEMRMIDKIEKGEITEDMMENLSSQELFMLVMED